eukprot:g3107.t1
MSISIGFLGAGQMAEALAVGFINKSGVQRNQIHFCDPASSRVKIFTDFGAIHHNSSSEVAKHSQLIFVAVKPQYVTTVLTEIEPVLTPQQIVISIAAGITLQNMISILGVDSKVIRVMPNTPCLVGEMAGAMAIGGKATKEDAELVLGLFDSIGKIFQLDEKLLTAVTALSGCGPAYVFLMIEALSDGGVLAGLPRDVAMQLAAQTVLGSAKMVLESGKHPGALKDMVTSPGGVTIAAVKELENGSFRGTLINAMYLDVLSAQSTAQSFLKDVQKTTSEIESINHEIAQTKRSLSELEAKGAEKLKERYELEDRVQKTTTLLSKLKTELAASKVEFEQFQLKIKEAGTQVGRLHSLTIEKENRIKDSQARLEIATKEINKAKNAMKPQNLPVVGSIFKQ